MQLLKILTAYLSLPRDLLESSSAIIGAARGRTFFQHQQSFASWIQSKHKPVNPDQFVNHGLVVRCERWDRYTCKVYNFPVAFNVLTVTHVIVFEYDCFSNGRQSTQWRHKRVFHNMRLTRSPGYSTKRKRQVMICCRPPLFKITGSEFS